MSHLRKLFIICFALLLFQISFAANKNPNKSVKEDSNNIVLTQINSLVNDFKFIQNVPGMAVILYYQGQPHILTLGVSSLATGQQVTANTAFQIGSITKTFTAILTAEQVVDGKISLDDEIGKYLPLPLTGSDYPIDEATFEQLATHTASLPRNPPDWNLLKNVYSVDDLNDYLSTWQPSYPMGEKYQYSNIGFGVLGEAVAGVASTSYSDLLAQDILEPLGMSKTYLSDSSLLKDIKYAQGYTQQLTKARMTNVASWTPGAGAIISTPNDMLQYLEANIGVISLPQNLKQAIQLTQFPYFPLSVSRDQALAWSILEKPYGYVLVKDGGTFGFTSFMAFDPNLKIGVVILANKNKVALSQLSLDIMLLMANGT